jgi:hypothetical protein
MHTKISPQTKHELRQALREGSCFDQDRRVWVMALK